MYRDELYHHGVLGQKWGIRRYQNKDGTLTAAGKAKYRTESTLGNVGRAVFNTSLGQRIAGTGMNKGYREDKREIKDLYKQKKEGIKTSSKYANNKQGRKEALKSLKNDYKLTKGEARVSAAEALYRGQTSKQNKKIQTQHLGKQWLKSFLAGGYGTLRYDRLTAEGQNRGKAAVHAILTGAALTGLNYATGIGGTAVGAVDYLGFGSNPNNPHKKSK